MDQQHQSTQANESRSRCMHEPALEHETWLVGAQLTIADHCWVKHGDDHARNFDKSPEPIANSSEAIAHIQWMTRVSAIADATSASYSFGEDGSASRSTDVRLVVSVDCGQGDAASGY